MKKRIQDLDLARLNSATKYPSIPTYHVLEGHGALSETLTHQFQGTVYGREKVDGTNARIVFAGEDTFILGSREDFLHARGDLIHNPAQSIVKTIRSKAEELVDFARSLHKNEQIVTFYVEVYGGNVHANSKNYTGNQALSYRAFDISLVPFSVLDKPSDQIASWRDTGGQSFLSAGELAAVADKAGLEMAPDLFALPANEMPKGLKETFEFLNDRIPKTLCSIDGGGAGKAEGIVVRSEDRSKIAKIRFEDYARTWWAGKPPKGEKK